MQHRVAIHDRPGSFSDRWRVWCEERRIPHVVVDGLAPDIIGTLRGCTALLWHFSQNESADLLAARHVLTAAELMGLRVFPDAATSWHFDDKIAQKYLLEAAGAPLAPVTVLYDRASAERWAASATFPKVFKLRRGAGSVNVRLIRSRREAASLVRQAFGAGFVPYRGALAGAAQRVASARASGGLGALVRRAPSAVARRLRLRRSVPPEVGYLYVQDYLPGNAFDTRVTVIGGRAFSFTRNVRPGDFRASGSGSIDYDRGRIDPRCLRIALDVTRRIRAQSCAFDFAFAEDGTPRVLEVSYGYKASAVHACEGYWDEGLDWHPGHCWPQDLIIQDLLEGGA